MRILLAYVSISRSCSILGSTIAVSFLLATLSTSLIQANILFFLAIFTLMSVVFYFIGKWLKLDEIR